MRSTDKERIYYTANVYLFVEWSSFFLSCFENTHTRQINDQVKISCHEIKKKRNSHKSKSECTGLVFLLFTIHVEKRVSNVTVLLLYSRFHQWDTISFGVKIEKQTCGRQFIMLLILFFNFHLNSSLLFIHADSRCVSALTTQINEQFSWRFRTLEIDSRICRPWIVTASHPEKRITRTH